MEGYGGQTIQELIALAGRFRIDSLVLAVDEAIGNKSEDQVSTVEKTILSVEALEREVNNGGFSQFFLNQSNVFSAAIVDDLNFINCRQTAAIVKSAIELLEVRSLSDLDAIRTSAQDESKTEAWEELDEKFFSYPDPIADRLWEFIKKHHSQIQIPE